MTEKNSSLKGVIFIIIGLIFGLLAGAVGGLFINSQYADWAWLDQIFPAKNISEEVSHQNVSIEENSAITEVVAKVSPGVVSVVISKDVGLLRNSIWSPFGIYSNQSEATGELQKIGGGSGMIVSADGMILTNSHVVDDDEAEYSVILNDGTEHQATIVARDSTMDVAILKIDATDLTPVEFGDSDSLKAGQTVLAIGNTLAEYENTVTRGVISGIGRTITAGSSNGNSRAEVLNDVIQTDAAINPGNSGGPLLNLSGQVIGINTAVDASGQLIGFAIPINNAIKAVNDVREYGKIIKAYMGVRYLPLTKAIAKENNLDVEQGALLVRGSKDSEVAVIPGSPADKAGLVENDIITKIDDQVISTENSLQNILNKYSPGDTAVLEYYHDGELTTGTITFDSLPE